MIDVDGKQTLFLNKKKKILTSLEHPELRTFCELHIKNSKMFSTLLAS
jgi:hypothetical protein